MTPLRWLRAGRRPWEGGERRRSTRARRARRLVRAAAPMLAGLSVLGACSASAGRAAPRPDAARPPGTAARQAPESGTAATSARTGGATAGTGATSAASPGAAGAGASADTGPAAGDGAAGSGTPGTLSPPTGPLTAGAGGWLLPASSRTLTAPGGGVTELHDAAPGRAPGDAPRTPLRPGTISLSTATGGPDPATTDAAAVDGALVPLRSPVYLDTPPTGGAAMLTVLVTGAAACHDRLGLALWALEDGNWAAAVRLPGGATGASADGAACPGGQLILRAPAPDALTARPPTSVLAPPAEALTS